MVCPEVSAGFVKVKGKFEENGEGKTIDEAMKEYLKLRKEGICPEFFDAIDFHLKMGAKIGRVVKEGRRKDVKSGGYNIIMVYTKKVVEQHGRELSGLSRCRSDYLKRKGLYLK